MNPFTKFNHIPWKYVVGMNLSVLALAVTFATLKPTTTTTENRSQAKEVLPTPLIKPSFDPEHLPQLLDPDIDWAKVGDAVVIKGTNLGSAPFGTLFMGQVKIPQENIIAWEPQQIVFTVPDHSITAPVTLTYTDSLDHNITLTTKTSLTITDKNK